MIKKQILRRGFSLIEVIIAVLLIGFLILLINNLPNALHLIGVSSRLSLAKQIVSQKIESLKAASFDSLANGFIQISDVRLSELPSGSALQTVSDCPPNICLSNEDVKQISIEVSWIETNNPQSLRVSTLIARNGLY